MSIRLQGQPQVAPDLYSRIPREGTPQATAGGTGAAATATVDGRLQGGPAADGIDAKFREQFGDLAQDPEAFHAAMQQIYGEGYDASAAEGMRQQALAGDFSWLPPVQYVDAESLGGANGAYDQQNGVIYINEDLRGTDLAAQTFVEEAGHHLDTLVNKSDTAGDEGELFRRILGGENLSQAQVAEIRAENDMGTIVVNGKEVQVEFWNPFKAIGDAAKAVGGAIADAAKAVGGAIKDAAEGVVEGVKTIGKTVIDGVVDIGKGIVDGVVGVGKGLWNGISGFATNLFQGNFIDAFGALGGGILDAGGAILDMGDEIFLQVPQRLIQGTINGANEIFNGMTELLGPAGGYVREVTDRVFDAGRTLTNMGFGTVRDLVRAPAELAFDFVRDLGTSAGHLFRGEFGEAGKAFGGAFLNLGKGSIGRVVDIAMRNLQGALDIVELAAGRKPSRPISEVMTEDQLNELKAVYGDSIDWDTVRVKEGSWTHDMGMAAHVVGNTIYMPSSDFGPDGMLNAGGFDTMRHEVGHIWQNQNGGGDYIHEALWSNLVADVETGNRNNAYDWRAAAAEGKGFSEMNAEQQAELIAQIFVALEDDGVITAGDWTTISQPGDNPNRTALSAAELQIVEDALASVRAGVGAP